MTAVRARLLAVLLALVGAPAAGSAQQPAAGTTVVGVVVDESSGAPVVGAFLSLGERGPRAITDSLGAFRLRGVAAGAHMLQVQRFGYHSAQVALTVLEVQPPLRIRMSPDPVVLDSLSVIGAADVTVTGVVRDARTGAPVPFASLMLSLDAVRPTGRASSDPEGVFRIEDVPTSIYFMRLQALGYQSRFEYVEVTAPPKPLELTLEPDSVLQVGVARYNTLLRGRRNYAAGINQAYDQERLHYTAAPSVTQFLELETPLLVLSCAGVARAIGDTCVVGRGGDVIEPSVYIDELPVMAGMEVLESYAPSDIYMIEVFGGGRVIRTYTYSFMEKMARRPRALLPP